MREVQKASGTWKMVAIVAAVIALGVGYFTLEIPEWIFNPILEALPLPDQQPSNEACYEQQLTDPVVDFTHNAEFKKRLEEIFFVSCTESAGKCLQSERMTLVMRGYCLAEMNHLEQYTSFVLTEYGAYTVASDIGQKMGARLCHDKRNQQ